MVTGDMYARSSELMPTLQTLGLTPNETLLMTPSRYAAVEKLSAYADIRHAVDELITSLQRKIMEGQAHIELRKDRDQESRNDSAT